MSPSVRHALLVFALPLATLFGETALPPALAALRVKAEAGNSIAQYNLGLAYAQGREIPADPIEAFVWLNLASESGTAGKAYDTLLQEITPAQLAEAKRRLAIRKNAAGAISPIVLAPVDETPAQSDRVAELTAKNQQLSAELSSALARLDAANTAAGHAVVAAKADANTVTDALNARLSALDAQLTAAKSKTALAESATQASEASRIQLAQEKASLNETVAKLTADKTALAAKLEQAGSAPAADTFAPKIAALEEQLSATKSELASAQSKLASAGGASARVASLENEVARANNQAASLQTQINELTADRAVLKQKLAEAGHAPAVKDKSGPQIEALQAQVAALTAAKSSAEQKLASVESRLATVPSKPAPANNEELAAANAKLETALRSFTLAQNENAGLKTAAETAKAESAALRQQLADAQSKLAAPAPVSTEDPAELKRQLKDTETKLSVALRSYVVVEGENDKLKADAAARADSSTQAIAAVETKATAATATQAAQLAEVRDQLRQVQAQSAAYAEENFQLRTRLATGGGAVPAPRGPETLTVSPVPAKALVTPTPTPAGETTQRTHTIAAGDTLQGIAKKYYGNASRWNDILAANRDVIGANQTLVIGRKLKIP